MRILVCITSVPDTTSKISFTNNNTQLDPNGVTFIIGPYDDYALARAVELREGGAASHITVINVGLADTEPVIRKALAIGADDAIRVNAAPTDSWFVATQIAAVVKNGNYDLVMMGRESIDYNSGVVHSFVANMLGWQVVTPVMKLDMEGTTLKMSREIEGGKEFVSAPLPLVVGCQEPIAEWKIPSMRGIMSARTKPLNVVEPTGKETKVSTIAYELPPAKSGCKFVAADDVAQLVNLLKTEAKVL
jgi:electron transfer flavoprotein beta subunit